MSRAPAFWSELPKSIEVVFVSALYGLVLWDEPIQEYDCHFADYTDDQEKTVKDLWGDALTQVLLDLLNVRSKGEDSPRIAVVYDLLSESLYQEAFRWGKVRWAKVHHRVFRGLSGPDVLTALATVLSDDVSKFAGAYDDRWYETKSQAGKVLEFGFEPRLDVDVTATREGDQEKTEALLQREFSFLSDLPPDVRQGLVVAELSRRKVLPLRKFDWGSIVVSFAKAVELYFKQLLKLSGKETLGEMAGIARTDSAL